LKGRILFTLGALAVYRLGAWIPVPGVDFVQVHGFFQRTLEGGLLGFLKLFTAKAFETFSLFALGLIPYFSASIIISLLTFRSHKLREWFLSGGEGSKKIGLLVLLATLPLAVLQGSGMSYHIARSGLAAPGLSPWEFYLLSVPIFVAGTFFLIWLGGLITRYGLGNGWAILLLAYTLTKVPGYAVQDLIMLGSGGGSHPAWGVGVLSFTLLILGVVLFILQGVRIIGRETPQRAFMIPFLPTGYLPIFLAVITLALLQTLPTFPSVRELLTLSPGWVRALLLDLQNFGLIYLILYGILILAFTRFYSNAILHPEALQRVIGPGEEAQVRYPILAAGIFLAALAILPYILTNMSGLTTFFLLGGTTILIIIGVLLDLIERLRPYIAVPKRQRSLQLVSTYRTFSHARAHLVKSQLERSGIRCVLQTLVPYPYLVYPILGPLEVSVSVKQAAQAEEVLQAHPSPAEEDLRVPHWEIAIWLAFASVFALILVLCLLGVADWAIFTPMALSIISPLMIGFFWLLRRQGYREYAYWLVLLLFLGAFRWMMG
jgi:preprotein translocase subunit SecY